MKDVLEHLSKEQLLNLIQQKDLAIEQKDQVIEEQKHIITKLQRLAFGRKSERFAKTPIDPNQLRLSFEEIAQIKEQTQAVEELQEINYTRKVKKHNGRNRLPDNLPVQEIVLEPNENTDGLKKIGEEKTEILEYRPAEFFKIVLIRPKYEKPNQEGVLIADMPNRPIHKCLAGNMLLSSILVNKYVDHLPLYRQRQIFKRSDIDIASSTIDSWIRQMGDLLEPLYQQMVHFIKNDGYLQADETPTRVLDKQKKGTTHRGYFWVYHAPLKRMVVFDYQQGRNKEAPQKILNEFKGYLQTDGYIAYDQFKNKEDVTHLGCWAHARRYFEQALSQDPLRAEYAMQEIQKLYAIERELSQYSCEEKKAARLKKALPILNDLSKWIAAESQKIMPKSLIGKAFTYTIHLWESLLSYLYDGNLLIDNNLIENSIRPNALGRKNYLFAGSHDAAQRSAMFYSFFGTCKMHNVDPVKWLNSVMEQITSTKKEELYKLFPQNINLM